MADETGHRRLTLSETRVARLVGEGLSDEQIAARLGITLVDVGVELAEVFRKLGLRSRTELALLVPTDGGEGGAVRHDTDVGSRQGTAAGMEDFER